MLLNRERVKFWQKIIFGAMAALMAGFLVFGYSGVANSCKNNGLAQTGNSALDKQLKQADQTLKTNPKDAASLLLLAQGYQQVAAGKADGSADQADALTRAISYYDRYLKLPDKTLGAAAADLRYQALQGVAAAYTKLLDYADVVKTYQAMQKVRPKDALLLLGLANAQVNAGQTKAAIATYQAYLKRQPGSPYAADVKTAITKLQAAAASPSPTTSP